MKLQTCSNPDSRIMALPFLLAELQVLADPRHLWRDARLYCSPPICNFYSIVRCARSLLLGERPLAT